MAKKDAVPCRVSAPRFNLNVWPFRHAADITTACQLEPGHAAYVPRHQTNGERSKYSRLATRQSPSCQTSDSVYWSFLSNSSFPTSKSAKMHMRNHSTHSLTQLNPPCTCSALHTITTNRSPAPSSHLPCEMPQPKASRRPGTWDLGAEWHRPV